MVEIKVTGNLPLEALANLTALGMHCMKNSEVHAAASRILESEKNTEKKKAAAAVDTPLAGPSGLAAGATGPSAAPSEKAVPNPTAGKAPSLEDVRAKGIKAAKKYGQAAVKAILKEFNADNMTALPEDKRAEFLGKLEGLGDNNA